jgi:hypothetical protein
MASRTTGDATRDASIQIAPREVTIKVVSRVAMIKVATRDMRIKVASSTRAPVHICTACCR